VGRLRALYEGADRVGGDTLWVVRTAAGSFAAARGAEAAAAMAFYALFSLFPLLLALVAGASLFLDREQVLQQAVILVAEVIPVSQDLVEQNLRQIVALRGPVGLISLAGALWSGSGFFTVLSGHVNRAWPGAAKRGFVRSRLVALAMFGVLFFLLVLSLLSRPIISLLAQFQVPLGDGATVYETPLWAVVSRAVPWVSTFALLVTLYHLVPNTRTPWRATHLSAAAATVASQAAAWGFAAFLRSGLAHYQTVYGGLGAVAILLFWIYLSSWIITFGAHLGAAIAQKV